MQLRLSKIMANLLEKVESIGDFKTFIEMLKEMNLKGILSENPGPLTVLAPTDAAFSQLEEQKTAVLQDEHKLKRVLMYHILFGDVRSDDLTQINEASTMEGSVVAIELSNDQVMVNNIQIKQPDILADNGVIHVIDSVLIPAIVEAE
jgi:uncharacterized surface protein with fasciclin (FAS1) repeats